MLNKNATRMVLLILSNILIMGLLMVFMMPEFISGPPVLFEESNGRGITHITTKNIYNPGDKVEAVIKITKKQKISAIIQWSLIGPTVKIYDKRPGVGHDVGTFTEIVPVQMIPKNAEPGEYRFRGFSKFDFGFKIFYVPMQTNKFVVK